RLGPRRDRWCPGVQRGGVRARIRPEGRPVSGRPQPRAHRLDDAYLSAGTSSFTDFLASYRPELLPSGRSLPPTASIDAPHGTTIVSLQHEGGVIMAGDRRATM